MDVNIKGNPGTGNTYTEINIGTVQNYNPNATTVNNYFGDSRQANAKPQTHVTNTDEMRERQHKDILDYVNNLVKYVAKDKLTTYETLWRSILALPEVAAEVYNPGKQHDTTFNRNLVANILCMMKNKGIIAEQNVTTLAFALEGDKDHSVRAALAKAPHARDIYNKVLELLNRT